MIERSLIRDLAEKIKKNRREIWEWQLSVVQKAPPPFYCSIDLRDSGHKIVPVDCNLYPAGFNNICPDDLRAMPPILRAQVEAISNHQGMPVAKKILILPEAHTTNTFYIENLYYLRNLVSESGFEVQLGWVLPSEHPIQLTSVTGKVLEASPISVENGILRAGTFVPDLILLNNDFSSGAPKLLDSVRQPIVPSHHLGWFVRKKSEHFRHYNALATQFAERIGIDPWIVTIESTEVADVNFNEDQGLDRVAKAVKEVLDVTTSAYQKRSIDRSPFAFVKNNSGTYGMGIMSVHSAEEILQINRRTKNKMSVGKNRLPIQSVIVQEGVPTSTLVDRLAAEPVIYLVGGQLVGGFLRTNSEKGDEDNLNSQGMVFKKLCMSDLRRENEEETDEEEEPELELVYGSVARLSALAAGLEISESVAQMQA